MENKIERPQTDDKKIHSKDEFELCYLRHRYLRRVNFNPTKSEMDPYNKIIYHLSSNTFYTYKNLFKLIGFELEDIVSIAKVHLVSFLGLYHLDKLPKKYGDFIIAHRKKYYKDPDMKSFEDKNKANFTIFMKQRMEDMVRISKQKARNIKGMQIEEFQAFYGPEEPPKNVQELLKNHEFFKFKKLDPSFFRSIKKKMNIKSNNEPFQFAGSWYVAVKTDRRNLTLLDFAGAGLDPYDNIHNKNPEELLFERLKEEEFQKRKARFKSSSGSHKKNVLISFINKNQGNPLFIEEINTANRILENLRD